MNPAQMDGFLSAEKLELLALLLEEEGIDAPAPDSIPPRQGSENLPLSFAQQRLWFLEQLEPGSAFYNMPAALRMTGTLNLPALEQTLNALIQRHESLRTTFTIKNDQPIQIIHPTLTIPISVVELHTTDETEVRRHLKQEAQQPFDLENGPLLRCTLLKLSETEQILLFTTHHIISDGWSLEVLVREVAALYESFCQGQPSPLPALPIQYADFALWQRQWLQGEVLETQLSYWKQQLAGEVVLELPADRTRPAVSSFQGERQSFTLSAGLTESLKTLSRQAETTLFMTLLAAFKALLYRYTSQSDLRVGTPVANRNRTEIEGLIGFFVNTLVLRTEVVGELSFLELLAQVRDVTLAAQDHQDIPFERLVEALQPERSTNHTPLFQVMFALQNAAQTPLALPGLTLTPLLIDSETAKFDLSLSVEEINDQLVCEFEYRTDLFDAGTITRMQGHFQTLLEGIITNPQQRLYELPVLTASERHQLLFDFNQTHLEIFPNFCIHQLFEAQVEKTPDHIAVVFENQHLTYRQLNEKANQLAHYLRSLGVKPEVVVGLCVERSLEMIVGILGILKAGGGYLPLDPAYPIERLSFMIEDANVLILLTQKHLLETLSIHPEKAICLDTDWEIIQQESSENPVNQTTSQNLVYVIYTSGSTGKPKGVMIEHHSLVNFTQAAGQNYEINAQDRILQFASISFDAAAEEIFPCLTQGATLVLRTQWMLNSIPTFLEKCQDWNITILDIPTALWHQITLELELENIPFPDSIRLVIIGGEKALTERLKAWKNKIKTSIKLINTYGPTEATVVATFWEIPQDHKSQLLLNLTSAGLPIGRPITNTQTYILDHHLQPVPIGIPGELYVGGAGVARGYLNRPDLTSEKFISNPFLEDALLNKDGRVFNTNHSITSHLFDKPTPSRDVPPERLYDVTSVTHPLPHSSRLYKTGDLVRYLPDGNIEYLGRIDHQVKIRGFRIELGEIEAVLNQHSNIKEVVVFPQQDPSKNQRIVAYIVPKNKETNLGGYREFLQEKLPDYMIPSIFLQLEKIPLTVNGKVNLKALPTPDFTRQCDKITSPRNPIEELLVNLWKQLLGIEKIGIHDNFFNLGGHSLLATQMMSRLQKTFKFEIPLRTLFESPTIAQFAPQIETALKTRNHLTIPAIQQRSQNTNIPLSFAQQRLWFIQQLDPESSAYNVPAAVRLKGTLNVPALQKSLDELVQRHEVFRTTFGVSNGQPFQVIHPTINIQLSQQDLTHLSHSESHLQTLILEVANQPFDLTKLPLWNITLFKLSDNDFVLLLTLHHIISDGWSMEVLVSEISAIYEAFCAGNSSPLPPLSIQYADFAIWQRQWLQGNVLETQLSYWQQQLCDPLPELILPTNKTRSAVPTYQGAREDLQLSSTLSEQLKSLSSGVGVTLFMTLVAAFNTLLYWYTNQDDIVIGTDVANRNQTETEVLIGFFVNQLVLRIDLSGNPTFLDLLAQVRDVTLKAYSHQDVPFEKLVEVLNPARKLSRNPLFDIKLVLQNTPRKPLELSHLTLEPMEVNRGTATFDLLLNLSETEIGITGTCEYSTDLYDADIIKQMLEQFKTLLTQIIEQPNLHLNDLKQHLTTSEKALQMAQQKSYQQAIQNKLSRLKRR
jgi:amino acid adenylation domain-containing protein